MLNVLEVRRSKTDLVDVGAAVLQSLPDIEPDLQLETWSVLTLSSSKDDGPTCPECGGRLTIERFAGIRPPPLEWRGRTAA